MKLIIDVPEDAQGRIVRPDRIFTDDDINAVVWAVYNGTPIPDNATNKDVIKAIFPNEIVTHNANLIWYGDLFMCNDKWFNAPYQKGGKE